MNILFIDDNNFQTQTRMALLSDMHDHTCELASTLADVHILFKKDKYNMVIMDYAIENGMICLEYILSVDDQQRMLMVSNAIAKSDLQGCDHCVSSYRRRHLSNPTPIKNILRMIEGFDNYSCDWYDPETSQAKS